MNIDEKIKRELESEASEIDKIFIDDQGLFDLARGSLMSGMKRWIILINFVMVLVTAILAWVGYRFFISIELKDSIFWGVCLLLLWNAVIAMKHFLWNEMQRSSLIREIKRVEVAVAKLASRQP